MFLAVLSLCVASCLAEPSIGYSYSAYAPLSHGYTLYSPYASKAVYPHANPFYYNQPYHQLVSPHLPLDVKTQYHSSDVYGQASYGHSESHQSHHAVQDALGNKVGSFSYVKPDGQVHHTSYVADANGYRVASNDLPEAPVAPVVPVVPHVAVPIAPQETAEVIAAKEAHFAAHAQALAEAVHSVHKRSIYSYGHHPVVTPNGYISDTPEVAAAKVAHFAEHAKRGNYYVPSAYAAPHNSYYSPYVHNPVVTADGYLADTPEVAAAKAAHYAQHAKASVHAAAASAPHHYGAHVLPYVSYAASSPHPVVSADGHVLDTPEVAAAKSAHLAEHAAALARNAVPVVPAAAVSSHYPAVYASHHSPSYYAPSPVVLPDGHLADTPDVAHAKAAHFAEYAKVASRQKRSIVEPLVPLVPVLPPVVPHAYSHSVYPHAYSLYPFLKPSTHTTVVHGPHAVSYTHQA